MSRDHQNDNAVWLCRVTKEKKKKLKATKGPAQSAFEPTTIGHPGATKSADYTAPAISESTTAW